VRQHLFYDEVAGVFVTIKSKNVVTALAIAVVFIVAALSVGLSGTASVFFGETSRKVPVYGVEMPDDGEKLIALSFDAAWGADKTQGILDVLKQYDAKATFFLVGFWLDKYEDQTKAVHDAGMEIANHSKNHLNMPKLDEASIKSEISYVNDKVKALTGQTCKFFRAPYGDYSNRLLTAVEGLGMVGVQWSIDSLDWKGLSASDITARIVPKAKSGDIVLCHNNSDHILDALPSILSGLKAKGFKFVTMSELVATENYSIDANGIQHKKQVV
jgi:peptidoglycan/xylan/chitin deacetylase (PgdA/CDA1 family)